MSTIVIIDYGMGNLHSISKALQHVGGGALVTVSADPGVIRSADRVVFPGVGAIRDCMHELRRLQLDSVVREVAANRPFLGVCLGLQALLDRSEENEGTACLGLVPGSVKHFEKSRGPATDQETIKIPHMGWNQVHQEHAHPLWEGIPQDSRFYFVHSYYVETRNPEDCAATTRYPDAFASVVARGNLFAVQFHPEKSQHAGLRLLENFTSWRGD